MRSAKWSMVTLFPIIRNLPSFPVLLLVFFFFFFYEIGALTLLQAAHAQVWGRVVPCNEGALH